MKTLLSMVVVFMLATDGHGAEPRAVKPFEREGRVGSQNPIDGHVRAVLLKRGIKPTINCSDAVFFRRVHLDVIGTLPEPRALQKFLKDRSPRKRAALIDELLKHDAFADYWSLKWCDLLRVKAEYPIKLWPNAVQAYHRWIRDAIRENRPYDDLAREMLTSSGSNFRVPQVNFYRAIQGRETAAIADAVALTFMGQRAAKWPKQQREGMAAFFSRVAYKGTAEWKEEIVYLDPAATEPVHAVFPEGKAVTIAPGDDPRQVFADWLITRDNPWFARNIVNRIWAWLMGRGIIHAPDDIRLDNPPVNPRLLQYLEKRLVSGKYDLHQIYRLILNSRTYQQSPIPNSDHPDAEALFAYYMVRRLDAEVLADALSWIAGDGDAYSSAIPEPFTFIPKREATIALADGSITSQFLEMFGRPARDTGLMSERNNKPTDAQRLHLLNSTHVQQKIQRSQRLRRVLRNAKGDRRLAIQGVYMTILTRPPTDDELESVARYAKTSGLDGYQSGIDLAWALVNTKEFLYRH